MLFTPLHQALGRSPGPIDDEFLDAAVEQSISEAAGIDWKRALPELKRLPQSDFPKDVAAMANSGGGVIVFGVEETQKVATGRADVGDLDQERYERALRSAAVTAISPPVFGLEVEFLGEQGKKAVVVVVPASVDGPHLIYRNEYFGAPIRNDADTVWMKEREIERMYRARFDEQRHVHEALDALYDEAVADQPADGTAWFVAVARPRIPARVRERMSQETARKIFDRADTVGGDAVNWNMSRPLGSFERDRPRPGLRRWVAESPILNRLDWMSGAASVHFDGATTLTAIVGGLGSSVANPGPGNRVHIAGLELAVADFMGLVRATGEAAGLDEYEVRIGIESPASELRIAVTGAQKIAVAATLPRFSPIRSMVRAGISDTQAFEQTREVALDVANQCGLGTLELITQRPDGR